MTTHTRNHPRRAGRFISLGVVLGALAIGVAPASAGSGGTSAGSGTGAPTVPGAKAKIVNGLAVAPKGAPAKVVKVIQAANHIAKGHPYCWGGGHASFQSKCYDCSGSVSYALHGGGLLDRPHAADFIGWADRGKGRWISVYANSSHVWMTVAGLRFDTADTAGQGPGWAKGFGYETPSSFVVRHKAPF